MTITSEAVALDTYVEDTRPKANPDALVSRMHARYVRIATQCVDAYLSGKTEYEVEYHPQAMAARADWVAADRGSEKSNWI